MNDFQTSNLFSLSVVFFLIIDRNYDYTMDYMENVARNFTKTVSYTHLTLPTTSRV